MPEPMTQPMSIDKRVMKTIPNSIRCGDIINLEKIVEIAKSNGATEADILETLIGLEKNGLFKLVTTHDGGVYLPQLIQGSR